MLLRMPVHMHAASLHPLLLSHFMLSLATDGFQACDWWHREGSFLCTCAYLLLDYRHTITACPCLNAVEGLL
jgi:hypothetical protein